jgi:hypothetical protein
MLIVGGKGKVFCKAAYNYCSYLAYKIKSVEQNRLKNKGCEKPGVEPSWRIVIKNRLAWVIKTM